ncbi:Gfo/Idh/MocA family oxidoreductase [soil metagenome]
MHTNTLRIAMNGVTGRMGQNQHLIRSILAIRDEGGVRASNDTVIWPEPILLGRNATKLAALAGAHELDWTTDVDAVLADPQIDIYFDAQLTSLRAKSVRHALEHGKHIYCEKPLADDLDTALELARLAREAGVCHGVVQDKLFLPGLRKLKRLVDEGFFGRILSVRGEFGYWVFDGVSQAAQRPSWNYKADEGGGIVSDMFAHWRYVLDDIIGEVRSVSCVATTHIPERIDEDGDRYQATAEDAAYAIFGLDDGIVAQLNSSWAVRLNRDELVEFQVDGTEGSAVAGLRNCRIQRLEQTPRAIWNPDIENPYDFRSQWDEYADDEHYDNGFKVQWEHFLRHVVDGDPFSWDFGSGAKGVQLGALGLQAWHSGCTVDVPELMV